MNYLQMLSSLGVGGAHPGGISLTKEIFEQEKYPISHTVLDVGCGTGQSCYYLHQLGYNVIGLDVDHLMIQQAKKRNKECQCEILYIQEDLTSTSLPDQLSDIILSESVLNFTNLDLTLPELKRILKPNGVMIAIEMIRTAPLLESESTEITSFYGIPDILSIEDWKSTFNKFGLSIYKIQSEDDFFSIKTEEPSTEFNITDVTPSLAFNMLTMHEELSLRYKDKLSFRVFYARHSV
ncbi:class I SAM-dependent methyltransferase [Bacillus sp. J37]|uniref:class I SAM-dependent methyltransferase n=1 Tax=Bacillus sp. J37 TaxID=935837 RepID=UPI0004B1F700|nr:class I SAM-dependent methyltransferase [Bacillus sp. J37]